jgi:hypothetical protein
MTGNHSHALARGIRGISDDKFSIYQYTSERNNAKQLAVSIIANSL